jgi:hypothetical protein
MDHIRRLRVKDVAVRTGVAFLSLLLLLEFLGGAEAETALEMQSWCGPIVNAQVPQPDMIHFVPTYQTGLCWGSFAAIQQMSIIYNKNVMMIEICAPADSTRSQFIRVFYKYVSDHPESANQPFAVIAQRALTQAFPCPGNQ